MTNTRIINHEFDYHAPVSLEEALQFMKKEGSAVLAGGTDLINKIKLETSAPSDVVSLIQVEELKKLSSGNGLTIGAMVPMTALEKCETVKKNFMCIYEAVNSVGSWQIRNMATIAGNIANASPAADVPPALIVHRGTCEIVALDESGRLCKETVLVEKIFTGPGKTILRPGQIIASISVPEPGKGTGSAFQRSARVKLDVAKASAAVFIRREGNRCAEILVCAGSVGPTPIRAEAVEKALTGKEMSMDAVKAAAAAIEQDIMPIDDIRSTVKYRNKIMKVLVRDAVLAAWKRSGGEDIV